MEMLRVFDILSLMLSLGLSPIQAASDTGVHTGHIPWILLKDIVISSSVPTMAEPPEIVNLSLLLYEFCVGFSC